jgi:hypothetical protein
MFVFEDILLVNDKGIQAVLKEVDNDELALALKTASDELKQKIFKNMSERARSSSRKTWSTWARSASATWRPPSRRSSTSSAGWRTPARSSSPGAAASGLVWLHP